MLGLTHYRTEQGWPNVGSPAMNMFECDLFHSFKNLHYDKVEVRGLIPVEAGNIMMALRESKTGYMAGKRPEKGYIIKRVETIEPTANGERRTEGLDISLAEATEVPEHA